MLLLGGSGFFPGVIASTSATSSSTTTATVPTRLVEVTAMAESASTARFITIDIVRRLLLCVLTFLVNCLESTPASASVGSAPASTFAAVDDAIWSEVTLVAYKSASLICLLICSTLHCWLIN